MAEASWQLVFMRMFDPGQFRARSSVSLAVWGRIPRDDLVGRWAARLCGHAPDGFLEGHGRLGAAGSGDDGPRLIQRRGIRVSRQARGPYQGPGLGPDRHRAGPHPRSRIDELMRWNFSTTSSRAAYGNAEALTECLNAHSFLSMVDACEKIEVRRRSYNHERPPALSETSPDIAGELSKRNQRAVLRNGGKLYAQAAVGWIAEQESGFCSSGRPEDRVQSVGQCLSDVRL